MYMQTHKPDDIMSPHLSMLQIAPERRNGKFRPVAEPTQSVEHSTSAAFNSTVTTTPVLMEQYNSTVNGTVFEHHQDIPSLYAPVRLLKQ